eukprot:TRINITY_DN16378_c0_g1_i1.p1 TRINITY_DN16378_c0_g1~~TRINITY_DN16378_c0_g1_i1.p1  ORF type:complete len:549 (+),score=49.65 TRINITY_DN16378_c0_g1_i1:145-1791(+)
MEMVTAQSIVETDQFHALLDDFAEEVACRVKQLRLAYDMNVKQCGPLEENMRNNSATRDPEIIGEREASWKPAASGGCLEALGTPSTPSPSSNGLAEMQPNAVESPHMPFALQPMTLSARGGELPKSKKSRLRRSQGSEHLDVQEKGCLETVVLSVGFEAVFAALIILNLLVMAMECEYYGLQLGFDMSYPHYIASAGDSWPWAATFFKAAELSVGCAFTTEVVLRMCGLRLRFFRTWWNFFDTIIISFWCVSLAERYIALNPMLLRLVRIVRLLRLLRLVRTFQMFDVLRLLIGSLRSSFTVLLWSSILLVLIMTVSALGLNFALKEAIMANELASQHQKLDMFRYFGSFTRSFLTMYELTFGNWVPVTRALHDVSEWFGPVLLSYQLVVSFAVLNVIRAIFIHETMKCASIDEDLMIMERERQVRNHSAQMKTLLEEADTSGDGFLDFDEFIEVMTHPRVKSWLSAMQVDVRDPAALFNHLDNFGTYSDGDGRLSIQELSDGVARLKGPARSMDLIMMMHEHRAQAARLANMMLDARRKPIGKVQL